MLKRYNVAALGAAVVYAKGLGAASRSAPAPAPAASAVASASKSQPTPAISQFYSVVREETRGLPDRTVYRPADLKAVGPDVPVIVWANGGCRHANVFFATALSLLSARGFIVIADGAPEAVSTLSTAGGAQPQRMTEVIDWVTKSKDAKKQFDGRASGTRIAVIGQSCGGIEALVAGADPRVDSVVSVNSGLFANGALGYGRDRLNELHSPVLFIHGGPEAIEYQNSVENYALVDGPAALVGAVGAGHAGIFYGIRDNTQDGTIAVLEEGVTVLVQWFDYTLNGNSAAKAYFTDPSGLSSVPKWTVETKGLQP